MLRRLAGHGLVANIGASGGAQLAQIAVQLVTIPILSAYWGLEDFGVWLLLFTLPAYLVMGDFGLLGAAANDMTMAVSQERRTDARATYRAVRRAVHALALVVMVLAALAAFMPGTGWLNFAQGAAEGQAAWLLVLLAGYGVAALSGQIAMVGLRATGRYARGVHLTTLTALSEVALALALVVQGGGLLQAAAAYLGIRLLGVMALHLQLWRHAPWLEQGGVPAMQSVLGRLAGPAIAMLALPVANALAIQGMVVAVGAFAGPAAVPVFVAARTLTRFAVQLVGVVSHAAMPEYSMAYARRDAGRQADLLSLSLGACTAILLPSALMLLLLGQWFVALWTGGAIQPGWSLIALLAATMVFHGLWRALSNLIVAINQQRRFSYAYLLISLGSLGLAALVVPALGLPGAAGVAALADLAMLLLVVRQARALGLASRQDLQEMPARLLALARSAGGKG